MTAEAEVRQALADAIEPTFGVLAERVGPIEFGVEWDSVDVEVLGDVALVVGLGSGHLKTSDRDTPLRCRSTGVLVERDGTWLWRLPRLGPGRW